jgi:uncharacterized membrane protein YhaH (DUF805 family)
VRRLHDIDRSGWWYLLGFVPLIDSIALSAGNVRGMFNTYSLVSPVCAIVLLVWACTHETVARSAMGPIRSTARSPRRQPKCMGLW